MNLALDLCNVYLFASVMATAFCAMYAFVKRRSTIHILFGLMCLCTMIYLFGYIMELNLTSTRQMLFWNQVEYLGIPFFPPIWIVFLLYLTEHPLKKSLWFKISLYIIPIITFLLRLTNRYHHLYYSKISIAEYSNFSVLALEKGPWYIVQTVYVTLCMLFGAWLLLHYSKNAPRNTRLRFYGIVLISFAPSLGILINLFNIWRTYLDYAAFSVPLIALTLFSTTFSYDLLKLKSYTRDKIFENSQDGIIMLNQEYKILDFNPAAQAIFPSLNKDAYDMKITQLMGESSPIVWAVRSNKKCQIDVQIKGMTRYFYAAPSEINSAVGRPFGYSVTFTDITNIIQTNNKIAQLAIELDKEKNLLKTTLLSVGDGVISTDLDSKIILMNPIAESLTGWTQKEAFGKPVGEVLRLTCDGQDSNADPIRTALQSRCVLGIDDNLMMISKNGQEIPIEHTAAPIHNDDGTVTGAVIVFHDFTEKKKRNEMVQFLSYHDQLTGIYNRRYFEEKFDEFNKEKYAPLSLVMADVNGLKLANDAFGHAAGDQLLIAATKLIRRHCRETDVFSRVGGDEFVLLMPHTSEEEVESVVQTIRREAKDLCVGELEMSISFGWDTKNTPEKNIRDVYKKAEDFMYQHKLTESPAMREKTIHRIVESLYRKIPHKKEHSFAVGRLCGRMGEALDFSEGQIQDLKTAGILHDIGEIAIDYHVVNHPGALSETDWIETKRHAELGYRILEEVNDLVPIAEIVLAHHENWDGSGYPKGLSGKQIPIQARIIRIADSYDAMTKNRIYRKAVGKDAAMQELQKYAGILFDPELIHLFLEQVIGSAG